MHAMRPTGHARGTAFLVENHSHTASGQSCRWVEGGRGVTFSRVVTHEPFITAPEIMHICRRAWSGHYWACRTKGEGTESARMRPRVRQDIRPVCAHAPI